MSLTRHGVQNTLKLEEAGSIITDRYGVSTARCVFSYNGEKQFLVDQIESLAPINMSDPNGSLSHPYASYLKLDKREVVLSPGVNKVICDFAGCPAETASVYEFEAGLKEEDIKSHPRFPLLAREYGVFTGVYEQTDNPGTLLDESANNNIGDVFYSDTRYDWTSLFYYAEFTRFATYSDLGGVEAFLDFSHGLWKQTYTSPTTPDSSIHRLGNIETPPGNPPQFGVGEDKYIIDVPYNGGYSWGDMNLGRVSGVRTWLYSGFSCSQRGGAYTVTHQWMLSGVGGWNTLIYPL